MLIVLLLLILNASECYVDISRSNIFKEPCAAFYIHTHYPKILLNHINIDEYEQREAENTKRSLTRYCLQKTKIKIQQDTHTWQYNTICDVKNEPCGSEQHKQNIER